MIAALLTPVRIAYDEHENRLCLVWDDLVEWQPGMREQMSFLHGHTPQYPPPVYELDVMAKLPVGSNKLRFSTHLRSWSEIFQSRPHQHKLLYRKGQESPLSVGTSGTYLTN
jgi:hypothetical protein